MYLFRLTLPQKKYFEEFGILPQDCLVTIKDCRFWGELSLWSPWWWISCLTHHSFPGVLALWHYGPSLFLPSSVADNPACDAAERWHPLKIQHSIGWIKSPSGFYKIVDKSLYMSAINITHNHNSHIQYIHELRTHFKPGDGWACLRYLSLRWHWSEWPVLSPVHPSHQPHFPVPYGAFPTGSVACSWCPAPESWRSYMYEHDLVIYLLEEARYISEDTTAEASTWHRLMVGLKGTTLAKI